MLLFGNWRPLLELDCAGLQGRQLRERLVDCGCQWSNARLGLRRFHRRWKLRYCRGLLLAWAARFFSVSMFGRSAQVVLHGFRQLAVGQLFVASRLLALVGSKALIEVPL